MKQNKIKFFTQYGLTCFECKKLRSPAMSVKTCLARQILATKTHGSFVQLPQHDVECLSCETGKIIADKFGAKVDRDVYKYKTCSICGKTFPVEEFSKPDTIFKTAECESCIKIKSKAYSDKRREEEELLYG